MGYMRAHAIIVDSWNLELLEVAYQEAKKVFAGIAEVTAITPSATNGHQAFMIAPDGSKEGWAESHAGDNAREVFKIFLNDRRYEDGSSALGWVEVMFADDEGVAAIVAHSGQRISK